MAELRSNCCIECGNRVRTSYRDDATVCHTCVQSDDSTDDTDGDDSDDDESVEWPANADNGREDAYGTVRTSTGSADVKEFSATLTAERDDDGNIVLTSADDDS